MWEILCWKQCSDLPLLCLSCRDSEKFGSGTIEVAKEGESRDGGAVLFPDAAALIQFFLRMPEDLSFLQFWMEKVLQSCLTLLSPSPPPLGPVAGQEKEGRTSWLYLFFPVFFHLTQRKTNSLIFCCSQKAVGLQTV